tara:strand:- start:80 stop:361 length:282 start_codon:yes stop_codon:yes gene_type:complete
MTNATARCAIRTKYHGATNYKPSRIIATGELGKVTVSYDHALDSTDNHAAAARLYVERNVQYESVLDDQNGLCFDHCYYWTWEITGPRKVGAA